MIRDVAAARPAAPTPTPSPAAAAPRAEPAGAAAPAPMLPNPRLRIDPALSLVVLEFRDSGEVSRTIPSAREIDAYRSGTAESSEETPPPAVDVTR